MRVLITGVTGFLGQHLARALTANGHDVWGFANEACASAETERIAAIDLLDVAALEAFVARASPEAVIHLGGLSHVGASFGRPGVYYQVNLVGTRNLLRAVTSVRGSAARVLVASSAEVYGAVPEAEQPIHEDRALDPRSPYALTKAAAELLTLDAGGIVTRSFNIVGPGQAETFALPSFARQLATIARGDAEPVLYVGDLSPRRDFLPVDDAMTAYRTLLEAGAPGTVYNIARGRAVSIGEMLDRLRRVAGVEVEVRRDEARVRPVDMPLLCGDSGRLTDLGWTPRGDLDEVLGRVWRHALDSFDAAAAAGARA